MEFQYVSINELSKTRNIHTKISFSHSKTTNGFLKILSEHFFFAIKVLRKDFVPPVSNRSFHVALSISMYGIPFSP